MATGAWAAIFDTAVGMEASIMGMGTGADPVTAALTSVTQIIPINDRGASMQSQIEAWFNQQAEATNAEERVVVIAALNADGTPLLDANGDNGRTANRQSESPVAAVNG